MLELSVADDDYGKVIGRGGRTAQALRTVVKAAAVKDNRRVLLDIVVTAALLVWGSWILSAKRIGWRDLLPFGVIGSALMAAYSVGATVYMPPLFSSYATDYGVIGAVLAIISMLFCVMLVAVVSAVLGREVGDELDRIRRGERPPDHEVRSQWDNVVREARSRWEVARERADRRGRKGPR